MGWRGKAIGGSIGSFLGPWGAVAGAAAGHFLVDRKAVPPARERLRLLAVAAAALQEVALLDGRYPVRTDQVIRAILAEINEQIGAGLSPQDLAYLIDDAARIDHSLNRLAQRTRQHPELARAALAWLWRVAVAAGDESARAASAIAGFTDQAQVPREEARRLALVFSRNAACPAPEQERRAASDVLGIVYHASPEQIKAAYRKLSLTYHPDKHAALDPEIRALAAEKFAQIKAAYDTLCGNRSVERFVRRPGTETLAPAAPGMAVVCFHCGQRGVLDGAEDPGAARCTVCQALLALDGERLAFFHANAG